MEFYFRLNSITIKITQTKTWWTIHNALTAARLGFEPRYSDSESEVLPLDDLAMVVLYRIASRNGGQCPTASEAR